MQALADRLIALNQEKHLKLRFDIPMPKDTSIFQKDEIEQLNSCTGTACEKQELLKELLSKKLNGSFKNDTINKWIVHTWGGIRSYKSNDTRLEEFSNGLNQGELNWESFAAISSLSKIASFVKPDSYSIYDSRVVFSLNWLILSTKSERKFFPMPASRNTELVDFNISPIINLYFQPDSKSDRYYNYNIAYFEYCKLVKDLSISVFGHDAPPYKAEMLLFSLANKEIVAEVKQRVKISIE